MISPVNGFKFCQRNEDGVLSDFFSSRLGVEFAVGPKKKLDVVKVRLVPDPEGTFWCWHDFQSNDYAMVFPSLLMLRACFSGIGLEAAEQRQIGQRARVRVEIIEDDQKPVPPMA